MDASPQSGSRYTAISLGNEMLDEFKWSPFVFIWLATVVIIFSAISFFIPDNPKPNQTVFLPGYQIQEYSMYIICASFFMAAVRKRKIILNFEVNFIEGLVALTGVALFISPFVALFVKFVLMVIANAFT
ncbi:MAG: hypothetical protein JAY90_21030 [Candidatus Thiodiazotropha lotti]|nr:hypothetical protein [Candidatus Thiodiazotropha lotti]